MTGEYRGYRFKATQTDKLLVATIWAPRVLQSLSVKPTATLKEGREALQARVQEAIDNEIAKSEVVRDTRRSRR
jgi:hypothetical protein